MFKPSSVFVIMGERPVSRSFSCLNMYLEVCVLYVYKPGCIRFCFFSWILQDLCTHSGSWVFVYGNVIQACQYFPQCLAARSPTEMFLIWHFLALFRTLLANQDKLNDRDSSNIVICVHHGKLWFASVLKWVWIILTSTSFWKSCIWACFP